MKYRLLFCLALLFGAGTIYGQTVSKALQYLQEQAGAWTLTPEDLQDIQVSDLYRSRHNQATHVYFQQRFRGIEVFNAITGVHFDRNDQPVFAANRFFGDLQGRINTQTAGITAEQSVVTAGRDLGLQPGPALQLRERPAPRTFVFTAPQLSQDPITAKLVYFPMPDGSLRLSWHTQLAPPRDPDVWYYLIDAQSGEPLFKKSLTIHCTFDHVVDRHTESCLQEVGLEAQDWFRTNNTTATTDGASYRVYPFPLGSPLEGPRELLIDPADPIASPFGWHDTNGQPGPEYTITRGNNAHAYMDPLDQDYSSGQEPNGGQELRFDFPLNLQEEPDSTQNLAASTTQLFYATNYMHDWAYHFGFTEEAGNFQQNTYGKGGRQGDPVLAEGQDGSGLNNANFFTPGDGGSGRMQMFLWTAGGSELLRVNAPQSIAGFYETAAANFGPQISTTPITGFVAEGNDDSSSPSLGCGDLVNTEELSGKVVLLDRGECTFERKVKNAEAAGAIACIICNFENSVVGMANDGSISDPQIPSVMLKSSDCALIRKNIDQGLEVTFQRILNEGPRRKDSNLDNTIVAHEYAHGISNRLTGGPSAAACLTNNEQMGEGWSDFFAMVSTVKPQDFSEMPRGIGNYSTSSQLNSSSFRRLPYSTDPSINNQTYYDIIGTSAPHPLGEVWMSMLWDLYWRFVEVYGFDPDPENKGSGNHKAIQLVMDGMKLQACNPGFVDGRDAIITADILNNDGANECLIWEVFANRGLGWNADQGSNDNRNDGFEAYDVRPECFSQLLITKNSTPLIQAGDEIVFNLEVVNYKSEPVTGVQVNDLIPNGATLIEGSVNAPGNVAISGHNLTFDVGTLQPGEAVSIQYRSRTVQDHQSVRQFFDDMEGDPDNWLLFNLQGIDIWDLTQDRAYSGAYSWFVPNTQKENDQILMLADPILITGEQPVMRFFHYYDTDPGTDGGIIEVSTNGGGEWEPVPGEKIFRNSYRGKLAYSAFSIPNLEGYWGKSEDFIASYVDLSDYLGQAINVRFRFGSGEDTQDTGAGWYVDDVEFMDMVNYQTEACVTSNEGDQACAAAEARGTVVNTSDVATSTEVLRAGPALEVFPNPAGSLLNVRVSDWRDGGRIELLTPTGQIVNHRVAGPGPGPQLFSFDLSTLPAGLYFVRVHSQNGYGSVSKFLKQ